MSERALPRALPFALFMAAIGAEEGAAFLIDRGVLPFDEKDLLYLYPVRVVLAAAALLFFQREYREVRLRDLARPGHTILSLFLGIVIFVLWINMDWTFFGGRGRGFDPAVFEPPPLAAAMIMVRLLGAVAVVPVMEELFWRSFLTRYLIRYDFSQVPLGRFTGMSFVVSAILFGLEHHFILAGIMAGAGYNILLLTTRSISQCILAHAVTNLALGIYVLSTGNWRFW